MEFTLTGRCSRLSADPPKAKGVTHPILSAELRDNREHGFARIALRDIDNEFAAFLRDGMIQGDAYSIKVTVRRTSWSQLGLYDGHPKDEKVKDGEAVGGEAVT
jgi:hypothetical protein